MSSVRLYEAAREARSAAGSRRTTWCATTCSATAHATTSVKRSALIAAAIAGLWLSPAGSQIIRTGQTVTPAFEGWEPNPDGSFNLVFGYLNRNWEQEFYLPVGPDNNVEPGGPDEG